MRNRLILIAALVVLCLTISGNHAFGFSQTDSSIDIVTPVHGTFVVESSESLDQKLYSINTYRGENEIIALNPARTASPVFDALGQYIAYRAYDAHSTIRSLSTGTNQIIDRFPNHSSDETFYPSGWSLDGSNILYRGAYPGVSSTTHTFYLFDVPTGTLTLLTSFNSQEVIPNITAPPGVGSVRLINIFRADRNPVFDQWVALQIEGQDPQNATSPEGATRSFIMVLLWNHVTGQTITANTLFNDWINSSAIAWSNNGKYLLLTRYDDRLNRFAQTIHFQEEGTVSAVDNAPIERLPEFWLGAGNLVVASTRDDASEEVVYYIGEIINGTWHETEFLRLKGDEFLFSKAGDWYIQASDEEKQQLSCLFDNALMAYLQVNIRGRVSFTGGRSSRLRTEPNTYSDVLTSMPEGTEFYVIGGAVCGNGYRWWQVRLDDNTTGWAAEANEDTYFLEPIGSP